MTQQQADLRRLFDARNAATSFPAWQTYQKQLDTLWRAMGYPAASPVCRLADEELVFPTVKEDLAGNGDGRARRDVRRSADEKLERRLFNDCKVLL